MIQPNILDRALEWLAPRIYLRRVRARIAGEIIRRTYYDFAASGRRTEGWRRVNGDGNAATFGNTERGRQVARDLVRNNPYAKAAMSAIVDHVVGWGISAKRVPGPFGDRWQRWAETPACDADDRLDFAGLQRQVVRTVAESGECLIRRRIRRAEDGLPLPFQLQVLEPDFLDSTKTQTLQDGGWIIQGVEFSPIGDRVAYWLFRDHPGSTLRLNAGTLIRQSDRLPASEILHVFEPARPGQQRGVSWFDAVMLRLRDLDDYEDAALMKQKVAACLAVVITDADGSGVPLGTADDTTTPGTDRLEPGGIIRFPAGNTATVVDPPSVSEHDAYTRAVLRSIATGLGIAYEDLTGDYEQVNFSSARMARLRAWDRVHAWRWTMLQPQFLDPVWAWAVQMAGAVNVRAPSNPAEWTAPPLPMLEPDREGLAYARNIRSGLMSLSEAHRELGYDPATILAEIKSDLQKIDAAGLILDSDPRKTTQAGQLQGVATPPPAPASPPAAPPDGTMARVERMFEAVLIGQRNGHAPPPQPITVDARTTVEAGAITAAPPPALTINAPMTIESGAITPAPVTVDARSTIEPGALTLNPPPQSQITVVRTPKVRGRRKKANPPPPEPA